MKNKLCCLLAVLLIFALGGCDTSAAPEPGDVQKPIALEQQESDQQQTTIEADMPQEKTQTDADIQDRQEETEMTMKIQIGDDTLTAELADNSSVEALLGLLQEGPVTIHMSDYAGMEKVGPLPQSLPRNDEQISTDAGDLILYQGSSFVIYYGPNSWNLTRLGKVTGVTAQELREILGSGDVTAMLSLPE